MKFLSLLLVPILFLTACAGVKPEDARLAASIVGGAVLQYGVSIKQRPAAIATINSASQSVSLIAGGLDPAVFRAELSMRLPKNQTHDFMVNSFTALYTRFQPDIPKLPANSAAWVNNITLGLQDSESSFVTP
jgi:hypothetical protein